MKTIKVLAIAFAAILGFTSCESHDCEFIEVDYSNELVGTWTCLEAGYASAYIIKKDGTVVSTGLEGAEYWEEVVGSLSIKNNKISIAFESGHKVEGRFDLIPGESLSIVNEEGIRHTYHYCKEDLSKAILGMWVYNDASERGFYFIERFMEEDGDLELQYTAEHGGHAFYGKNAYRVVGDLLFHKVSEEGAGEYPFPYFAKRMVYSPNGTSLGDVMTFYYYPSVRSAGQESYTTLYVESSLELLNKSYDYVSCYVINSEGIDKDIEFMNTTFNFAKMDGALLDKFLKSVLFNVHFPDANLLEYNCFLDGEKVSATFPIELDDFLMTIKTSTRKPVYRDVTVYAFQDVDGCRFHILIDTPAFVDFFGNLSVSILAASGQLDLNDVDAVNAIFDSIEGAITTFQVGLVLKAKK